MNLFEDVAPAERQHPIYRMIKREEYGSEREVLRNWAERFIDRDGKFVYEFQTTFEPSFWELYVHACLRRLGHVPNFDYAQPDFVIDLPPCFCVEATISAPAKGGPPPHGFDSSAIPEDFDSFNAEATLRLCNSISKKEKKYRDEYSRLDHVWERPFVIALAPFDRPLSHMAASRPILTALYGVYYDEMLTIRSGADRVISYSVEEIQKSETAAVPVGYFGDSSYSHIAAVFYSPLATWGKVRALADNPQARSIYTTFHPREDGLYPEMRVRQKDEYWEDLLDGVYVFHNPYASQPLSTAVFDHPRVAHFLPCADGGVEPTGPDDFLLFRYLMSVSVRGESK